MTGRMPDADGRATGPRDPESPDIALAAAAESLAAEAGLDAIALGERAVERAVRARLVATGLTPSAWAARLRSDQAERTALIDAVVVPETMLFRDGAPFEALMAMALARQHAPGRMRVLSAACSTGEEAYSAAIALLAGGLSPAAMEVHGLDVSAGHVAVAASGVLPRTALRGPMPAWAEAYLERRDDGSVAVAEAARRPVTFRVANLLGAPEASPFDAVLCRNLLIYLTPPARTRVLGWLAAQLAVDAPLFVGHAEIGVLLDAGWRRSPGHGPYALQPPRDGGPSARPARSSSPAADRGSDAAAGSGPATAPAATAPSVPTPAATAPPAAARPVMSHAPVAPSVTQRRAAAVAQAEAGDRDAAVRALDALVRDAPDDVEAHALLGVLHATAGRTDAARQALRRALYLDPDHAEARAQLILIDTSPVPTMPPARATRP
jgi:chemotaxis protein methyltransferase WspC